MEKRAERFQPRDMTRDDVEAVAELHRTCLPDSLLTQLGMGVLRCYCGQVIEESEGIGAVLEDRDSGRIVGLAFATLRAGYRRRMIKRHPLLFAWHILWGLVASSAIRRGLVRRVRTRRMFGETRNDGADPLLPPSAGLEALYYLVALHPDARGFGNAERLVRYIVKRMFDAGASRILAAVDFTNLPSQILHQRVGFKAKRVSPEKFALSMDREDSSSGTQACE